MSEYIIEKFNEKDRQKWQDYVFSSENANFFHLIEWKEILEKVYKFKSIYLIAKDKNEKILGIFPIFYIQSLLFGKSLKSLPFHFLGGPTADSKEITTLLLKEANNINKNLKVKNFQIKTYDNYQSITDYNINLIKTYVSFIVPLSQNHEEVYKTFSKNIQRDIFYGLRDNKIIIVDNEEKLKLFYNLFVKSNKQIGMPSHDFRLFKLLWEKFDSQNMIRISLAQYKNKIIAGHFTIIFKNKILYMWGAINRKYKNRLGMQALQGESIKWGCKNGYKFYDFGWTSPAESGAIKYKQRWGTIQKNVYFYSLFTPLKKDRDYHTSFKIVKLIWSKLPNSLVKKLSPIIAKHLG